uniref:histone deacetylase family protein n=1 Tax=Marinobacterium profundum TaxID=1714300 RepID=UPI00082C5ACE|nr:histone deacetylase family protein [Marinobacterium profundum]
MTTAFISHADCSLHNMGPEHPESPLRLLAIRKVLERTGLMQDLAEYSAIPASTLQIEQAHSRQHRTGLERQQPEEGIFHADDDTALCPDTLNAATLAAGASIQATDLVLSGASQNAFCSIRPPGHHAEQNLAMGFCFYNNVAIGALHALQQPSVQRVAIVDFDVHHGNGTVDIFKDRPEVLVCSTFQHPYYPERYQDIQRDNILNCPLPAYSKPALFRHALEDRWLPALQTHKPDIIFISAGFDAHAEDPMADLELTEEDYRWATELLTDVARQCCNGRIVSVLEGGYNPVALGFSVQAHLEVLAGC